MSKQKQDKQGGGWQFPRPLEIIKCKEGNKEYMKERPARKPYGRIVKVCEFSLEAVAEFGDDDARTVWRLAKRAARDFLRVSWINTAIVTAAKTDRPYAAFARNRKSDTESEAKNDATVLTEIGYIKANTDEIKAEQKEQRKTNTEFVTRLTAVEASAKQAHKRIDTLERAHEE